MLVLKRNIGEKLICTLPDGRTFSVTVTEASKFWARLGIDAPADVIVDREEIHEDKQRDGTRCRA